MSADWMKYIDAAHRKVCIAAFHCEQLGQALKNCESRDGRPDIPVQAYFEGTVVAAVSAIDQVAQAANSALGLGLPSGKLFDGAVAAIEERVPEFKAWREQPIGRDLRRLRTRMVHYSYTKSPSGDRVWQVEPTDRNYSGSRELLEYAQAVSSYAQELGAIADNLQQSLDATRDESR